MIIGRAGASPPSRATGAIILYTCVRPTIDIIATGIGNASNFYGLA